jgi:hypothetical protein
VTTVRQQPADFRPILSEIEGEFPRSSILVAQAAIDHQLELLLKIRLKASLAEAVLKTLFGDGALYGSYARRVDAAYLMGLIGPETVRDLQLIGEMREECVRNMHVISFETGRIAECFRQLRQVGKPHPGVTPGQQRFVFAGLVYELVQGLMMKSGNCAALAPDHTSTHVSE